jgi:hypothetical protein
MTYYYCYLAYKDESTTTSTPGTIAASMVNLKPLPPTSSRRTETLNQHNHRPYRKAVGKSALNKTDEHCRSLFNLLPTSLRPRHHHQTSNNKGVDAVSMKNEREDERERARIQKRSIASYCCFDLCSDTSFIYDQYTSTQ